MIIETEGLSKTFRRHDAVRHVSLTVPKGSVFTLVGENGAGKTTTLRMRQHPHSRSWICAGSGRGLALPRAP
jgi:ABC-type multidrug transport system ATPase subunit